jgi:hypothetical protein
VRLYKRGREGGVHLSPQAQLRPGERLCVLARYYAHKCMCGIYFVTIHTMSWLFSHRKSNYVVICCNFNFKALVFSSSSMMLDISAHATLTPRTPLYAIPPQTAPPKAASGITWCRHMTSP